MPSTAYFANQIIQVSASEERMEKMRQQKREIELSWCWINNNRNGNCHNKISHNFYGTCSQWE